MTDALETLTDKEKEALRLLLDGHDAKSSASSLGISVHTINDRLRNARRKLGVSNSREAARILGAAEEQLPQNHAHTSFGMEDGSSADDNAILNETRRSGLSRAAWLTGGMLIMSIAIAAAVVFLTAGVSESTTTRASGAAQETTSHEADVAALNRANAFLDRTDAFDWQGSWDVSGGLFQSDVSASQWATQVAPVREPLGKVRSRSLASVERQSSLPGAPGGEFQVLQFNTMFENERGRSIETVVMMKGPNGWEVTGYFIA